MSVMRVHIFEGNIQIAWYLSPYLSRRKQAMWRADNYFDDVAGGTKAMDCDWIKGNEGGAVIKEDAVWNMSCDKCDVGTFWVSLRYGENDGRRCKCMAMTWIITQIFEFVAEGARLRPREGIVKEIMVRWRWRGLLTYFFISQNEEVILCSRTKVKMNAWQG